MTAVLIPAYEPDTILVDYARTLAHRGYRVVVADDGSGDSYDSIFAEVAPYAELLRFPENRGKGAVLKSLYAYLLEHPGECRYCITADSDGQHAVEDVCRVDRALQGGESFVLGTRTLGKGIPFLSKLGNDFSRLVYAVAASLWLSDNQTGLRGFALSELSWMCRIRGEKYDYELSVLWAAALSGTPIKTLPIQTIYHNNNAKTHFRAFRDTLLLYKNLVRCDAPACCLRLVAALTLLAADLKLLPWPGGIGGVVLLWAALNGLVWLFRKVTVCKQRPIKGAVRDILFSAVSLLTVCGLMLLFTSLPMAAAWVLGRMLAVPIRYFLCEALSKAAVSSLESAEMGLPK